MHNYENSILNLLWIENNGDFLTIQARFPFFFNKIFVTLYVSYSSLSIMPLLLCSFKNIPFLMRRLQKLSVLLADFYVFMAHYFWNTVQTSYKNCDHQITNKDLLKSVWSVKEACINTRIRTYSTCCWKYIKYLPLHLFVPY